jgi:formylglycine-generating enzyme required for sulfatase activity
MTLDLIWLAPGTFTMGSPVSEVGPGNERSNERPTHRVTISKGFWLGKTPVTQGQYQAVMGDNPSNFANVGPDAPVETVSWNDAMEFCRKLTEQERGAGRLPEGYAYMLPSEAQWEYACRAGTTGARYGNLDDIAWYNANSGMTTHPVAQKQPNAWGLYDMLGNVEQWCSDWYSFPYPGENVTDPVGADSGSNRVIRGSDWLGPAVTCRAAIRFWYAPGYRYSCLGFRVALAPAR